MPSARPLRSGTAGSARRATAPQPAAVAARGSWSPRRNAAAGRGRARCRAPAGRGRRPAARPPTSRALRPGARDTRRGWQRPPGGSADAPATRAPADTSRSGRLVQPGGDQSPGDRLRRRRQHFARVQLRAREPAGVLELTADAHLARGACGRAEPEHQRRGEGPRLRGVVTRAQYLDAGLFRDLARHRVLEALARLDETGDGGIASRRPARLPAEQRTLAVADQHDDGGIQARVELLTALRVRAAQAVAGALRDG